MRSKIWIVAGVLAVAAAALGIGWARSLDIGSPSFLEIEPDFSRQEVLPSGDPSRSLRVTAGLDDDAAVEPPEGRRPASDGEAPALVAGSERAESLEDELDRTERALAAARSADPTGREPHAPASQTSSEALAAAAAGSSAVALGCESEGAACRSSADCCPGLACAGGVAGYGTEGRCQARR